MNEAKRQEIIDLLFEIQDSFSPLKNNLVYLSKVASYTELIHSRYHLRLSINDLLFSCRALRDVLNNG